MKQVRRKVRAGSCNEGETYTVKQTVIDGCGCEYYIFVCVPGFHKVTDYESVPTERWVDVTDSVSVERAGADTKGRGWDKVCHQGKPIATLHCGGGYRMEKITAYFSGDTRAVFIIQQKEST